MLPLETILQENQVEYEIIQHTATIRTAKEGAALLGIEIGQTAPTLVLRSEKEFFALILSGARGRIDMDEISNLLNSEKLSMATPEEVKQVTGCTVGSVPLVGHSLPCIMDRMLSHHPFVYGGTGSPTSTLKIKPADLERVNHVVAFFE
ncbi:aminoacyl-tRNA deacylase [Brevibacillus panacihumi]|uniref:YbaK/aminoacyl-tRNA synthetase-associated domain-containing protein n=1 Tax=Brevibacillus panacihumi TaxID=497735 RepID=A0A3M8D234_9BACL|nr:YbaK/EbsC family protein [Brevibacillus panacihumi]RNB81517.1 hypothetical protein EDM58_07515 [Brevibacillus panacihumi]